MREEMRCPFCDGTTFKPIAVHDLAWCATCHRLFKTVRLDDAHDGTGNCMGSAASPAPRPTRRHWFASRGTPRFMRS